MFKFGRRSAAAAKDKSKGSRGESDEDHSLASSTSATLSGSSDEAKDGDSSSTRKPRPLSLSMPLKLKVKGSSSGADEVDDGDTLQAKLRVRRGSTPGGGGWRSSTAVLPSAADRSTTTTLEPPDKLTALLLGSFPLMYHLLATTSGKQGAEGHILDPLLDALARNGQLVEFLTFGIGEEVRNCTQDSTLFRDQSVVMLCFSHLAKEPGARTFISDVISPVTDSVFSSQAKDGMSDAFASLGTGKARTQSRPLLETDLDVLEGDVELAVANAARLQQLMKDILKSFLQLYKKSCPVTLQKIVALVLEAVRASKYSTVSGRIAASFMFLRFLVPALCLPDVYGVGISRGRAVPTELRRPFVKMGRIIQTCINSMTFPDDSNDCMFNPWLARNADLETRFVALVQPSSQLKCLALHSDLYGDKKARSTPLSLCGSFSTALCTLRPTWEARLEARPDCAPHVPLLRQQLQLDDAVAAPSTPAPPPAERVE